MGSPWIESQLAIYQRDPLYRFTEGEARQLADEVLRLREALRQVSSAYGDFAGCSAGTRNGASESEHTPACREARAALGIGAA